MSESGSRQTVLSAPEEMAEEAAPVTVRNPADVLETLSRAPGNVAATILDPWYNRGVGGTRPDYHRWLRTVIDAASTISPHVFVWGFPDVLARHATDIPAGFRLAAWLTWYYKNCPSVIRGWRSAQNACLHLASKDAPVYPEHFLTAAQRRRWREGAMRFIPGPPTVFEAPLNIGFVGKREQTGHPAQKPLSVIEPLVLMATKAGDLVLDPMCGGGTTGEACIRLQRRALLCDESREWVNVTRRRIKQCLVAGNGKSIVTRSNPRRKIRSAGFSGF